MACWDVTRPAVLRCHISWSWLVLAASNDHRPQEDGMKLTIFAATGGIGRHAFEQALAAGHDVTAVVRDPTKLTGTDARVVVTDLAAPDRAALESAVGGADAVLSGLGPRSRADAGIASRGTRAIVAAMQARGAQRLVVVSAAPIGTVATPGRPTPPKDDPGDGFFMRHLFSHVAHVAFRDHYADLALMEDVVRDSGLDWTIVRPPKLTDKPFTGTYRTAAGQNIRGGWSVPRADVADLMLRVVERPETRHQVIGVAS
jgi:putative NADH-flavin reductase